MSTKIYNHTIETNEKVKGTIKEFRKAKHKPKTKRNDNKPR